MILQLLKHSIRLLHISHGQTRKTARQRPFGFKVLNYKDSGGDHIFKKLSLFSLSLLAMPLSNADVEQVFSQMSLVKSKLRNRMGLSETLSSILHIKYGLRRQGIRCKDFSPSQEMFQRFNSRMYSEWSIREQGDGCSKDGF